MKFSTQEVMAVPIQQAFDLLTEFSELEQAARRRGAQIQRLDALDGPAVGMQWMAVFVHRNRGRRVEVLLTELIAPHVIGVDFTSQGIKGQSRVELLALSPQRTRVMVSLEMRPGTLAARLLLQSLKIAKARLTERYKARVAQYLKELELKAEWQRPGED
ncbi:DNA polymerase III subunit gamma/tau [Roseobacter cerasinus]|uniref:DNA polymerase III subunit gamma/tau n=1 Tax=Roseobacter cerasinus TaxID=2602289 RepID=A0A640VU66_9RHOB|nr:SRPBCC family protein [Roseobacter cerasinus]GFE51144.1 DNA polymerase III subunit gamma/tau [Roseobacter cerasinus]